MGYLKPWRRKIGALTLLIACVLMAGWVRSLLIVDSIVFMEGRSSLCMQSRCGQCRVIAGDDFQADETSHRIPPKWKTYELDVSLYDIFGDPQNWRFNGLGFAIGTSEISSKPENRRLRIWAFPYYSIVIPLTLLSAWLLLSRIRKPATTAEPAASKA